MRSDTCRLRSYPGFCRMLGLLALALSGVSCGSEDGDHSPGTASVAPWRVSSAEIARCDSGVTFSGPIEITTGGTYSGNWESTDPDRPAVNIHTTEPVTITNSVIRGSGDLIYAAAWGLGADSATPPGVTLTVMESCFVGMNPNIRGKLKGSPISIYNAASVLVEHNTFEDGGYYGVWLNQYNGNRTGSNTIVVRNNLIRNIDGRYSDGAGGYIVDEPNPAFSHGVIFSEVRGVPGIEVSWNQIVNEPRASLPGDPINLFNSSGTPASPLHVHDNYVEGIYAADPARTEALQFGGCGIIADGGPQTDPDKASSFIKIANNQVVSFANCGIQISVGHDNEVDGNRVISSGILEDGTIFAWCCSRGIEQNNYRNDPPGVFGNNSFTNNLAGVRQYYPERLAWYRLDYYYPYPPARQSNNQQWTPDTADAPTLRDEEDEWTLWVQKLIRSGQTVGRTSDLPGAVSAVAISDSQINVGVSPARPAAGHTYTATCVASDGSVAGSATSSTQSMVVSGLRSGRSYYCAVTVAPRGSPSARSQLVHLPVQPAQVDCLLNWGERNYPGVVAAGPISKTLAPYRYRYYPFTQTYVGVSNADQHLYLLPVGGSFTNLGPASAWLNKAGCS